jgi:TolA-binding protein
MKAQERHKLKENQFAKGVLQAREALETRQRDITWAVTVIVVLLVLVGGYTWWRQSRAGQSTDLFAQALAVYQAPVVPPAAPAPGSPAPIQQPGTFMTERAKLEAALPKFVEAADRYPSTNAGIAARYHAASILATLGRYSEAEQRYQEVVAKAGGTSLYARTARLGLADAQMAQKKYDNAIAIYTELSRDKNSQMPIDGVLMQLGRACVRAGKKAEAVTAFTRITTEFPQSPYLSDAQQELEAAKKLS